MRDYRLVAALLTLAVFLALSARGTAASGDEVPSNVNAFANAPGWITVTWEHSGEDIYGFVLEQESPFSYVQLDGDKRIFTVAGLEANRTYRYRLCAVYNFNRACSDYATATTLPPPPPVSTPAPATPSQATPKSLTKPMLVAVQHSAREIVLTWEFPGYADRLTSAKLFRDGQFIYEAVQPGNFDSDYVDVLPRPNTEYAYKLCFANPDEEQCSNPVITTGKPTVPSAPADVTLSVVRLPGGGAVGTLGTLRIEVRWRNGETPGQYITVMRQEVASRPSNTDLRDRIFGRFDSRFMEVTRLSARTDPTVTVIDMPGADGLRIVDTKTYRVCAVVPALGAAGRACSQPVTLP
jgi:hypothetical protein